MWGPNKQFQKLLVRSCDVTKCKEKFRGFANVHRYVFKYIWWCGIKVDWKICKRSWKKKARGWRAWNIFLGKVGKRIGGTAKKKMQKKCINPNHKLGPNASNTWQSNAKPNPHRWRRYKTSCMLPSRRSPSPLQHSVLLSIMHKKKKKKKKK